MYNLYKLSILPNHLNQVLIPPYPYIATNGNDYVYIEAECPKLSDRYLCKEDLNYHIKSSPDCVAALITVQHLTASCSTVTLVLTKQAMEKLDDAHYSLVFPNETKVILSCGRNEYLNLKGSYLATLPTNCSLHTGDLTIVNANNEINGQPMKILLTSINNSIPSPSLIVLRISSIDLKSLHNLFNKYIFNK
ncbi:unnamed protein product [Leptosia nina]|uniref:Uncharacterized protein n=1 Tax=Leptosia nina TaxID=320188 RepID=A0AAV1JZH9_9NEOP